MRKLIILALFLLSCVNAKDSTILKSVDDVWPRLQERYRYELDEAIEESDNPKEVWESTDRVIREWEPAWWAMQAVVENPTIASYCCAREIWEKYEIHAIDLGCHRQRNCWKKPD